MKKEKEKFEPRNDIMIEGNLAKFQLSAVGAIQGAYAGEFIFRCYLSPTQKIFANREYREMLGGNPTLAGEHETFLAYALSQLKYRIVSAPPFWTATRQINGSDGDIVDEEIITAILDAAIHSELKFKHESQKKKIELLERAKAAAERIINGQDEDELDDEDMYDEEETEEAQPKKSRRKKNK